MDRRINSNGDFLIKLFGAIISALVISVLFWVGSSLNALQITMAEVRTKVSSLDDTVREIKSGAQNTVDKQLLSDKLGDVYRRVDDHERRILLIERAPARNGKP